MLDAAVLKQTTRVSSDSQAGLDGVSQDADAGKPAADSGRREPEVNRAVFEVVKETKTDTPVFNIVRPKQLSEAGARWPVIAWANCARDQGPAIPLSERWAAAGFVVFSLASMSADVPALGLTTETEHRALVDAVYATSDRPEYTGKLDLDRIVVAGNACGGLSALQLAAHDDRLAAVFVLSGSSDIANTDGNVISAIHIPVGYVVGGEQDISAANAAADFNMLRAGLSAMIVRRTSGDLITLSTDQKVLAEAADISLRWLVLALYGSQTAYDELLSPNVCTRCTPGDWTLQRKNLEALLR